jgi:hypothetical protein
MFEHDGRRQWVFGAPQRATKENLSVIGLPRDNPGARHQARWDRAPQVSDGAKHRQGRGTPNSCASAERVRARETARVLRKLDLSPGLAGLSRLARRRPPLFASICGGRRSGSSWACCMRRARPQWSGDTPVGRSYSGRGSPVMRSTSSPRG